MKPLCALSLVVGFIALSAIAQPPTSFTVDNPSPEGGRLEIQNSSKTGATTNDWSIWNMTGGYGNGLSFWRYNADGTSAGPAVWFGDNGNVGIGTQGPVSKLEITNGGSGVTALNITGGGTQASTAVATTHYPLVSASGTNYIRNLGFYSWNMPIASGITDNGYRIGLDIENFVSDPGFLGTLNQQFGLWARVGSHAAGSGTIQNSYGVFIENLDGPATIVNRYGLYQSSATAKNFFAGNVGIGTTNPTEKLAVNGRIRAKEVIVDTGWSDYVFAKDYKLASLSEVEQHIQQQGHLPGVPSAAEVAEKGVSVGDMQALLLAKIEELTLHQIAQEKRLQTLEAENARLKSQGQ